MRQEYNIYCDESCHLEKDKEKVMVLGAIWVPSDKTKKINKQIRELKIKHKLNPFFEIKWRKVGAGKLDFYIELLGYFFNEADLHLRALVIADKSSLKYSEISQTHDDFYYSMYFDLLKVIFDPQSSYNIYIDIKDTRSQQKVEALQNVLRNAHYDYSKQIVKKVQQIHSHEVEILQLTDLLIGALSYLHREINTNESKLAIISKLKELSHYSLIRTTLYRESKVNIFIWKPVGI